MLEATVTPSVGTDEAFNSHWSTCHLKKAPMKGQSAQNTLDHTRSRTSLKIPCHEVLYKTTHKRQPHSTTLLGIHLAERNPESG